MDSVPGGPEGSIRFNIPDLVADGEVSSSMDSTSIKANDLTKPCCIIVLGMAGSGKTTFVQRLTSHLHSKGSPPYVVNLDPACREVPYPANIDIRDTVNYKQVMKQYKLGSKGSPPYEVNLDPACREVPYPANIDIR